MPAGFHVASAWVDIHAEDGGLRGEIERAIEGAAAGADARVKLQVDAADLRTKVESAIKSATAGANAKVKLDIDAAALRSKVEGAVKAASEGAQGEVKLDLDSGSLRAKVSAAIKAATAGSDGKVTLDADTTKLSGKVKLAVAAASASKVEIPLDLDSGAFQAKVKAATAELRQKVEVGMDLKDDGGEFQAKVRAAIGMAQLSHVNVGMDVNTSAFEGKVKAAVDAVGAGTNVKVGMDLETGFFVAKMKSAIAAVQSDAHVKIDADTAAFESKVRAAIGLAQLSHVNVGMDVDTAVWTAKIRSVIDAAGTGAQVKVGMDLKDEGSFAARVKLIADSAAAAARPQIKLDIDPSDLGVKLASAVKAASAATGRIKINTDIDMGDLAAKTRAAVAAAGADVKIRIGTDIDYVGPLARLRAAVAAIHPTIHINTDVDRNGFAMWASRFASMAGDVDRATNSTSALGRSLSQIPGLGGLAAASGPVIAAAFAAVAAVVLILVNDIALLVGALAAIALPAGIIALGGYLQAAHIQFGAFLNDLKSLGSEVSASMGPAIAGALSQVMGSLTAMKGQLTAMFSNAAQLVQPFTQALMGLVSGALPGITAALGNLKSAMPGIISGFNQIGQGIGNFFSQLTQNGAAIGNLWQTIGVGINQVATALGAMMSNLASNPQTLAVLGQSFQLIATTITALGSAIQMAAPFLQMFLALLQNGVEALRIFSNAGRGLTDGIKDIFSGNFGGALKDLGSMFSDSSSKANDMSSAFKDAGTAAAIAGGDFGDFGAKTQQLSEVQKQAQQNAKAVADAYTQVAAVIGSTGGQIASQLTLQSQGATAVGNSYLKLAQNAQSTLGGQIALAQAISQAKSNMKDYSGALTMTNGQLNLTSTKSQQAAQALNQIAQAGVQAATAMGNQGNWTGAAAAIDKARSSIVTLGQQMGLSKTQAQQLANQLTTFPDKEVQFKLNVASAMNGISQVQTAFANIQNIGGKSVTINAVTAPAQAALEALGFKIKDLGNGKVEVTAKTDAAKASLDALKTVLDALQSGKHDVSVTSSSIPTVESALKALGATVTTLPNGDIKVTATDGATTVIHGVKGLLDDLPKTKEVAITARDQAQQTIQQINGQLKDLKDKDVAINGKDNVSSATSLAQGSLEALRDKTVQMNANDGLTPKAKGAKEAMDGIPPSKSSSLDASGNAQQVAGDVALKINGLPNSKAVVVMVSINGTEQIDKLTALNKVQNKAIAVSVSITGTDGIDKLTALNNVKNKNIFVSVSITGAENIAKLTPLNSVNSKNISVVVSIQGNIDKIAELKTLNTVNNKQIQVTVNISGNLDKINDLKQLNSVANKNINVSVSISGADQIDKLKQIKDIPSKTITITVNANTGAVTTMKSAIDGVKSKTVTITASANSGQVNTLKTAIGGIKAKSVTITANAPTGKVTALHSAIDGVKSKTVTVTANVNGTGAVQALVSAIAAVHSKTVTVTVNTVKTGSAATGGYMSSSSLVPGYAAGGRSYITGGNVYGQGTATSDSILARLSNGEFVIRAAMVKKYGPEMLAAINNGAFASYMGKDNVFINAALKRFASGGQVSLSDVQPGDRNSEVLLIQKALKEIYPSFDYSSGPGVFGPRTTAYYSQFQKSMGYRGSDADGSPGIYSLVALANRTGEFSIKTSQQVINYVIKWGDTLTSIARKFGTSVDELVKLNKIKNPDRIYAGDSIKIPIGSQRGGGSSYVVPGVIPGTKPGDPNYLPITTFSKLTPWTTKDSTTGKQVPTSANDDLMKLVNGGGAFVSQFMFPGNNDQDFTYQVQNATNIKDLTKVLDTMRYTVQNAFKNDAALSAWLQQGTKILGNYQLSKDSLNKAMEDAKKNLDDLTKAFDDLHNSVTQNIVSFANITKAGGQGASVDTMIRQLTANTGQAVEFAQQIDALKGRGLNSTIIGQIAAAGPVEGSRTAASLLQATPEQIAQINQLQTQVEYAADQAGLRAADAMYGAGKAAAQGLVDGIQANLDAINAAMTQVANAMATAIKQALGIKSPSRVFHGFGVNTIEGLVQGLQTQGKTVPQIIKSIVDEMVANGQASVGVGVSASNSGTITPSVNTTATAGTSGDVHIGNISVSIDGGQWDLTKTTDRKALAKALVTEIMDEIREQTKKRK